MNLFNNTLVEHCFFSRNDLLECSSKGIDPDLRAKRLSCFSRLNRPAWKELLEKFHLLQPSFTNGYHVRDKSLVSGDDSTSSDLLLTIINDLIPWRKGPWEISGNFIDAEWISDIKYNKIRSFIKEMNNPYILDIGSGNGYYGFRALHDGASQVICIDPSEKNFLQFELFQKFAKEERIQYEILGFEEAPKLPMKFDIVLCMGVLYHQKNPFYVIECARKSLKKNGILLLESMSYPGNNSFSFMPPGRYAKARNVYFLPTSSALISLCKRIGFKNVNLICEDITTSEEQRKTKFAPFESLDDFLDPNDKSKTIEGYPAPRRALICAKQ